MYACDHKVLIGYHSNAALKWHMILSQLSEVWSWCWDHGPAPVVLREAILPHSTRDCLITVCWNAFLLTTDVIATPQGS